MSEENGSGPSTGWIIFWVVIGLIFIVWYSSHEPTTGGCEDWIQDQQGGYCGP